MAITVQRLSVFVVPVSLVAEVLVRMVATWVAKGVCMGVKAAAVVADMALGSMEKRGCPRASPIILLDQVQWLKILSNDPLIHT